MTTLICKRCQTENPLGSRFCNNCGQAMPPTSHLICPSCQAQNSRHLMYCDECGARLLKDQPIPPSGKESQKPATKPPAAPHRAFNLPTREPGDTGELDLSQLRDWFKPEDEPTVSQEPPSAAESSGEPDAALGDLDDWLSELDELTPEAADEPTIAADETFTGWLRDGFDEEDEPAPTETDSPAAEELPNWFSGDFDIDETAPTADSEEADALSDWLSNVFDGDDDETPLVESEAEELPDWFSDTAEEEPAVVGEEPLPDWLSGGFNEAKSAPTALAEADDLPDWLSGAAEEEPAVVVDEPLPDWLSAEAEEEPAVAEAEDLSDWLSSEAEEEPAVFADADADEQFSDWLVGDFDADEPAPAVPTLAEAAELPDWLSEEANEDEPALESDDPFAAEDDLDWLSNSDDDLGFDAEPPSEELEGEADHLTGFTSWLNEALVSDTADETADDPIGEVETGLTDWLDAALFEEIAAEDDTADADDELETPDWLMAEEQDDLDQPSTWDDAESELEADDNQFPHTGELPDWLVDLAPRSTGILSLPESEDSEFRGGLTGGLDWLRLEESAPEPASPFADEDEDDFFAEEPAPEPDAAEPDRFDLDDELFGWEPTAEIDSADEEESLDWLSEIALTDAGASESAEPKLAADSSPPTAAADDTPDWLSEFAASDEGEANQVADWFDGIDAERWPEMDEIEPDSLAELSGDDEPSRAAPLKGVPSELAASSLPDWLSDAPGADDDLFDADLLAPSYDDLPDWLRTGNRLEFDDALEAALPAASARPTPAAAGEWDDILGAAPVGDDLLGLGDLPPADAAPAAPPSLAAASEIPAWMQSLKPRELMRDDAPPEPEEPPVAAGPLAGLRSVIGIEPVIAQPHKALLIAPEAISADQQQRAALLRQLTQADETEGILVGDARPGAPSAAYRLSLTVLLLLAIVAGLLAPNLGLESEFLRPSPPDSPAAVELQQAVQSAANRPILVVFDYTPAMAGELDPQAALLLRQMAANGSQVMTISQSPAGLAIAQELTAAVPDLNHQSLGYLPGEALGLRYLAGCFLQNRSCETVNGRPLAANLSTAALIVVITGERDNLINWVEQVGQQTDIPLTAVMTQALAPTAAPYRATGQLSAVLDGPASAAAYEQLRPEGDGRLLENWQATTLARWTAILLLIGGNLWFGLSHFLSQRRRQGGNGA